MRHETRLPEAIQALDVDVANGLLAPILNGVGALAIFNSLPPFS